MDTSSLIVIVTPTMNPNYPAHGHSPAFHRGQPRIPGASRAAPAGYLYVPVPHPLHGSSAELRRWVQKVPIVKQTANWIYYTSDSWDRREAVVSPGCISRDEFETDTRCHDHCPRNMTAAWCVRTAAATATACMSWPRAVAATSPAAAGTTARQAAAAGGAQSTGTRGSTARTGKIGAVTIPGRRDPVPGARSGRRAGSSSPPARPPRITCTAGKASEPNKGYRTHLLSGVRRAMADAHPDRGGTTEQFIDARRRYQTALRPARR